MEAEIKDKSGEVKAVPRPGGDLSGFVDSYATFNRVVNTLQRQYLELKEDFSAQNDLLAKANRKLVSMSARNLTATEFLNNILTSLSAGVIAVDQDGIITHFNPAASVMLGIPSGEPLGQHYRDAIPPGDPLDANALRVRETEEPLDGVEKQITLADGSRLFVSVSVALLKNEDGHATGAVEIFHDLTKIKRMEQEIARLNTLAALGEMAAAVAHQVRNPLSGILGYGSLLKRELSPDDPRQKLITKITDGVQTLNSTVTTLLNYTQNQELNRESIELRDFIYGTVQTFNRDHADLVRRIEFHIEEPERPSESPRELFIDPVLMRQVLHNLFTNACEACDSDGHIHLAYRKLPRQAAIEEYADHLLLEVNETIFELTVTDDGPGLPKNLDENIFAPFFTTREGGNGLGLAVAWKIVKGHSGDLFAGNTDDAGARFTILLAVRINPPSGGSAPSENSTEISA